MASACTIGHPSHAQGWHQEHKPAEDSEVVLRQLQPGLAKAGFDIQSPLQLSWYNDAQTASPAARIPPRGTAGSKALAVLIGNSKLLWPAFLAACAASDALLSEDDPLDRYTEQVIGGLAQPAAAVRVLYAHDEDADTEGEGYVGMQLLAEVAGIAYNEAFSHLSLHPKFGSWFALRAVLVFDNVEYLGARRPPLPNPMDSTTQQYVRMAVRSARNSSTTEVSEPGDDEALAEARAEAMRQSWKKWVAVRDAPCSGHNWRYSEQQVQYHYTHSKRVLRQAVQANSAQSRLSGDITRTRSFSRSPAYDD